MKASLRALLTGIIDYAGLFPPARLPLDTAIRKYIHYRAAPEAWMLSRFICPAARLSDLSPFVGASAPLTVSALGRGGSTPAEFLAGLDADLDAIAAFRKKHGEHVVVDVLETRLPADGLPLDAIVERAHDLTLFFEVPSSPSWRDVATKICAGLAAVNARGKFAGFKLRCGGLEASAFPPASDVALALCAGVPFKATAGLHHPGRLRDAVIGVTMHGFINVFAAGILARVHNLDADAVEQIVLEGSPAAFVFTDDGFHWRDWCATTDQVRTARQQMISFGSCSFDEPRDDLRTLGWL